MMDYEMIWGAIKQPLRQTLLFFYALALNWLFGQAVRVLGFTFTEEQKLLMLSWGTPIVYWIFSFVDNLMHKIGKEKEEEGTKASPVASVLTKGIARF